MSERKVLNKYYPPDFDPTKIPRARQTKNRQFTVRLMAPCNMRCDTCGEYIYKGKKFNARKEDVENETYLGIRIYRFYIKCTRCLQEISFKTDPVTTDYIIEAGATRNFMALKLAEEQAEREEAAEKEDEATNPMKVLEKRTQASRNEMAVLEALEELKELNQRLVKPDYNTLLEKYDGIREEQAKRQEDEDEAFVQSIFGKEHSFIKRIKDESDSSDEDTKPALKKMFQSTGKSTDFLTDGLDIKPEVSTKSEIVPKKEVSVGQLSINKKNLVLVKPRVAIATVPKSEPSETLSSSTATSVKPSQGVKSGLVNSLNLLGSYGSSSDSDS